MSRLLQTRFLVILVALSFALLGAGCGDDDDDGGGGGDEAAQTEGEDGGEEGEDGASADFIEEADEICKDNEDLLDEAGETIQSFLDPESPTQIGDVAETLEEALNDGEDVLEDLQDLEPPASAEDDWDEALELLEEQFDALGDIQELAQDRSTASTSFQEDAEAISERLEDSDFEDRDEELEDLGEEIGLEECFTNE